MKIITPNSLSITDFVKQGVVTKEGFSNFVDRPGTKYKNLYGGDDDPTLQATVPALTTYAPPPNNPSKPPISEPIGSAIIISVISLSTAIYIAHERKCNGWGYLGWIILCGIISTPIHIGIAYGIDALKNKK